MTVKHDGAPKPLIMVVDDTADSAYALATILDIWGYQAVVATDPYAAIALAKSEPIALFILDIGMPGMDGYELGAALSNEYPGSAFIGNSAWPRDLKREGARGFSFDAYVQKPLGFTALERLIPFVFAAKRG